MLSPSTFITFSAPPFLKGMELDTPGFDAVQRCVADLQHQFRTIAPDFDLDSLISSTRSPAELFELIANDRSAELSLLEWLLMICDGSIWQNLPEDQHATIAAQIWQFVLTQEQLILPVLLALAHSSDRLETPNPSAVSEASNLPAPAFVMAPALRTTILDHDPTTHSARLQDQLTLIRALIQKQYFEIFAQAHDLNYRPRELFRAYGLPTQLRNLDKVERMVVEWFRQEQSADRCVWLLHSLEAFRPSQRHWIVSDLLCNISPEAATEHVTLRRWLQQNYWYRSEIGRQNWDFLADKAKENLPRWLSVGGWSDLKGAIALIQPLLPDWEQNQLKQRPLFWSHYTSRFDRVRILFCQKSYRQLTEAQQELFECLEPSQYSEDTELCIFDFRSHYVVEMLRGTIGETRIFPQTDELEALFFQSESLSLLQVRQQACDLEAQVHDHRFLWQNYAERWLRGHGVQPNKGVKRWQGLPPDAAQYDRQTGLPEPSESQKRDRRERLIPWWEKLRQLQAKITPQPEPKPEPEPKLEVCPLATCELVQTLTGHKDSVGSVCISPDGRTIVSGSNDKTIKIWNLETGELHRTLTGHENAIYSVCISPDGRTIVSGSKDKTIKIWNLETGELQRTLTGHQSWVLSVCISPDGCTIVSGSDDKTIKIWNLETGDLHRTLTGHKGWVRSVCISPDSRTIVSGSDTIVSGSADNTIKIWNLETGELHRTLTGHNDWVRSVCISPDSHTIVSGSADNTIKIWNLETGELQRTLTGHQSWFLSVCISPDGRTIVSGSANNTIKIWNLETGELHRTLTGHENSVISVCISPDGRTLVSGGYDKTIKIWRATY